MTTPRMREGIEPEPVKVIVATLYSDDAVLREAGRMLEAEWGEVDYEGREHPFDVTAYYEPELGRDLRRRILGFSRLAAPDTLVDAKLICLEIENTLREGGARRANLDVGFLDLTKLVLAATKFAGQRIYLGRGVYADLVGRYCNGRYQPFEWTYPDFRDGRYDDELLKMREMYRAQLRAHRLQLTPEAALDENGRRSSGG